VIALRKLGFEFRSRRANRLGFSPGSYITGWAPFPKYYPGVVITSEMLDKAWAAFLENPPSMMRCNYRHPTNTDYVFACSDEVPWWRPMLMAVSRMGRDIRAGA